MSKPKIYDLLGVVAALAMAPQRPRGWRRSDSFDRVEAGPKGVTVYCPPVAKPTGNYSHPERRLSAKQKALARKRRTQQSPQP
jgi:hypothetical protein